jgi:hypothetical protein
MNTSQLYKILAGDRWASDSFRGVLPCDKLKNLEPVEKFPTAVIANTDPSGEKGEHWVCYYFDKDGNTEYFDSYGIQPVNCDLFKFWKENGKNQTWNTTQLQGMNSTVCGHWCLAFLTNRSRGQSMEEFVNRFSNFAPGHYDYWVRRTVNGVYNGQNRRLRRQVVQTFEGDGSDYLQCCCTRSKCKRF